MSVALLGSPATTAAASAIEPSDEGQTAAVAAAASVGTAGLELVGPDSIQVHDLSELERSAWTTAYTMAMDNRDAFGYPWLEEGMREVRLAPASELGRSIAYAARAEFDPRLEVKLENATASIADLDALADDLTRLNELRIPDADLVWKTEPDHLNNRIIVTVAEPTPGLMKYLAARFGTTRLAVRIQTAPTEGGPATRNDDYPLFFGGAFISTPSLNLNCTTGFSWTANSNKSMVFAGHCAHLGGKVSYPSFANVGNVTQSLEENWSKTVGTHYFTNQSIYRGDIALIRYYTERSGPWVYSGAKNTSTNSPVSDFGGWSIENDTVCANGAADGENCGKVSATGINMHWTQQTPVVEGDRVWVRNVVEVDPTITGQCPINGDSGGPVYKELSNGTKVARGIHHGTYFILNMCRFLYTDIMHAYYGLPGLPQTT